MDQNNVDLPGGQPEQVPGQVPGDQEQAPVPQPPTVEQLAQVIQAMDQRMQQLSVEAEARRLTHAQKLREADCKAMARMPKFSGEGTFRTFQLEYAMWLKVNRIEEIPDEDFKKFTLLSAFQGKAADMVRCVGLNSQSSELQPLSSLVTRLPRSSNQKLKVLWQE